MASQKVQLDAGALARRCMLDYALYALSVYVLPALMILLTAIALFAWEDDYPRGAARALAFQVLADPQASLSPAQAAANLRGLPRVQRHDTGMAEAPFWIGFSAEPAGTAAGNQPVMVEFPSRHAIAVSCWDGQTLQPLGSAGRAGGINAMDGIGGIQRLKAGFALSLGMPAMSTPRPVLCRMSFVGPARLTALQWPAQQLQASVQQFHRHGGLLDGGMLMLTSFVLITAVILRSGTYVLFSVWLVLNLRMAALSVGWDAQWLGHAVPLEWLLRARLVTVALYYTVTLTLFRTLFRTELAQVGHGWLLRAAQWTCLPLLLLSMILSYQAFLPFIWSATGISISALVFFMVLILKVNRSPCAIWYSASIGVILFASLYEVAAAALGITAMLGVVNSVTAALASSLLAALAIAEQMRQEQQQRAAMQAELAHAYEAMPIGLFTLDMQGRFLSANPALAALLGTPAPIPGQDRFASHFGEEGWSRLLDTVQAQRDGELELDNSASASVPGPVPGPARRYLVKATLARGKIEGWLQDITEKSQAVEELRFMATHDFLTKVYNRRGIGDVLRQALAEQAEQAGPAAGQPLAVAYLDLDRFKLINDLYGHAAGDEVLRQVCERVSGMLRGGERIGRLGGDEFLIVMPGTEVAPASWICRGIIDRIGADPYRLQDKAFQVRGSIGLVEVSPGSPQKDVMAAADSACRAAKRGVNDGLVVYERQSAAFRERQAELQLVELLSAPDAASLLFLEMQPVMSLKAPHGSLNFEVLLRMRDRDGAVIPAARLIPAAETSGRIGMIDRWVMASTLAWLEACQERLAGTQFVCMNLSGASLNDERFVQDAFAMLAASPRAARRLCVEITESVALHDLDNTRRFIDQVRSYGVKVALDDFGAGYTSFSYLKELPADVLKIDGSFIVNMNAHPANITIVEAIVTLALNLGMRTIAEWAEDQATVKTLAELGVDYVQGYAISRPQAPEALLTVESAAGFIGDEALRRYVQTLGENSRVATLLPGVVRLNPGN